MMAECLKPKRPFGVVRAKEEGLAEIGCTAEIIAVVKQYPDGRMDIVTEGRQRFEIVGINQERSFLRAEVLYLQDDSARPTPAEIAQAMGLYREIVTLAGAEPEASGEKEEPELSFRLAGSLPLDLDFKQTLLGMKSEAERVPALASYLEAILPNLRRAVHARQKAGGNGHAH